MRNTLLVMLLAVVSISAKAEWVDVISKDGGNINYYADRSSISKEGSMVKVWTLENYLHKKELNKTGKFYLSDKSLIEFDCKQARFRVISESYYAEKMGVGDPFFIETIADNFDQFPPDSIGQNMWEFACGKR